MAFAPYSGRFEQFMNEICSPQNIAATAEKFKELEKQYGTYTFGKFAKLFLPNPGTLRTGSKMQEGYPNPFASASPKSFRLISNPDRPCQWCSKSAKTSMRATICTSRPLRIVATSTSVCICFAQIRSYDELIPGARHPGPPLLEF
jgi:hypothetical protein